LPHAQPEFLLRDLQPLLEKWKLAQPGLRVFAIPGNDDCQTVLRALAELEARGLIENIHRTARRMADLTLLGLAFVPPTPFAIKDFERRDTAEDTHREPTWGHCVLGTPRGFELIENFGSYLNSLPTLEQELNRLPPSEPTRTVAVIHCPPYETRCDVLFDGRHIGSKALRHWIERRQPLLTLHGHIHESPKMSGAFFDRLGVTTVINPGCDYSRPHLVFIDLEKPTALEHSIYGAMRNS
jgi:Icc-related predicted phosphoesterase